MKLSIITINYNNSEGLKRTLESVVNQTNKEFEHIIVDGGSSDGSVSVIKSYEELIITNRVNSETQYPLISWVSEKDKGIYNAMNKGIEIAAGKRIVNSFNRSELVEDKNKGNEENYVLMLNSGDYLVDEHVIERMTLELDGTDIVQGNNIEDRNGIVYRNRGYGKSDIDMNDVLHGHFLHQSSFCRRDLFDKYGYFDESYRIVGDTKFFMNCLGLHNATFKYVDIDVANYDCNGVSAPQLGQWNEPSKSEYNQLISELFSQRMVTYVMGNEKKVRLYDRLHQHKWIWNLTMMVAHINSWFYGKPKNGIIEEQRV